MEEERTQQAAQEDEEEEPAEPEPAPPQPDASQPAPGELPVLEEQVEPLPQQEALPEGHVIFDSEGRKYRFTQLISPGALQQYKGEALEDDQVKEPVVVLQATTDESKEQLERIRTMLSAAESPMLPDIRAVIQDEKSTYLVLEDPNAPTLIDALTEGLPFPKLINVLAQVSSGLSKVHQAGWLHLGLRPEEIYLSKPVKIMGLEYVTPRGEKPGGAFYIPGYSAPELIQEQTPDERADVYSVGALLYRGITGTPIAETGADMMAWRPPNPIPGVPQILASSLGDHEARFPTMQSLHAALLSLSRRFVSRIRFDIAAATTIGLEPTRLTNQDAYGYITGGSGADPGEEVWAVAIVSDGMGGMAAGEVASQAAVEDILRLAMERLGGGRRMDDEEQVQIVKDWMTSANEDVVSVMEARRARGGCTVVITLILNRRMTIAHVGDCRIYLVRVEEIKQLTQDHSLAVALALQGEIEMHEVREHPDRNMVTRSLGERQPIPDHYIDTLEQVTGKTMLDLQADDTLILCSDGLWEPVLENEMLDALRKNPKDLPKAASDMISLALERGAPDNATVLLVRMEEEQTYA